MTASRACGTRSWTAWSCTRGEDSEVVQDDRENLSVLPQERMRESGRRPARIRRTIGVAGLYRVRNALHFGHEGAEALVPALA